MNNKWVTKKLVGATLCATLGFSVIGATWIPAAQKVSAAVSYDTKITYGVNMREQASVNSSKIRLLKKGEQVNVVGHAGTGWLKIQTKQGESGFISSDGKYSTHDETHNDDGGQTTQPGDTSSKRKQVVELAKSYMGRVSYEFGVRNTSQLIFDCSSFTEFIYDKVGVDLKWGTSSQKLQGKAVSRANLQTGDLIFFDSIGSNNGAINHVGIYMGNGQFIHNAPSADGVKIDSLNSGWWKDRYVSSRSVL
ncbi:SH3 domain-containing protein [Paenibacillaceae bacterium GAS479]|nr:SH3 domain-containing protein [Paenibacillaceae bacterium GAS479]